MTKKTAFFNGIPVFRKGTGAPLTKKQSYALFHFTVPDPNFNFRSPYIVNFECVLVSHFELCIQDCRSLVEQ